MKMKIFKGYFQLYKVFQSDRFPFVFFDYNIQYYKSKIMSDPNNPTYHYNLGKAFLAKALNNEPLAGVSIEIFKDSLKNAITAFYKGFQLGLKDRKKFLTLIIALAFIGDFSKAIKLFIQMETDKKLSNSRSFIETGDLLLNAFYKNLAIEYMMKKKYKDSRTALGVAVAHNAYDFLSEFLLGITEILLEEKETAITYFESCINLRPYNLKPYYMIGLLYLEELDYDSAQEYFTKAIKNAKQESRITRYCVMLNTFSSRKKNTYKYLNEFMEDVQLSEAKNIIDISLFIKLFRMVDEEIEVLSKQVEMYKISPKTFSLLKEKCEKFESFLLLNKMSLKKSILLDLFICKFQMLLAILFHINNVTKNGIKPINEFDYLSERKDNLNAFKNENRIWLEELIFGKPYFSEKLFKQLNYNTGIKIMKELNCMLMRNKIIYV